MPVTLGYVGRTTATTGSADHKLTGDVAGDMDASAPSTRTSPTTRAPGRPHLRDETGQL